MTFLWGGCDKRCHIDREYQVKTHSGGALAVRRPQTKNETYLSYSPIDGGPAIYMVSVLPFTGLSWKVMDSQCCLQISNTADKLQNQFIKLIMLKREVEAVRVTTQDLSLEANGLIFSSPSSQAVADQYVL